VGFASGVIAVMKVFGVVWSGVVYGIDLVSSTGARSRQFRWARFVVCGVQSSCDMKFTGAKRQQALPSLIRSRQRHTPLTIIPLVPLLLARIPQ